ncbi:MAG TPA: hypothetical protein ENK47_00930 [Euryarchaeota archaeon]|nr:MAG: hypothetical protein B6U90_05240 [Thermoplasmatales archaeon ex4484_6]RLF68854.1 MAG: hypothetical protein DRN57_02680 [Thermoplasmata archaeon]HHD15253.1 hypothetical protein [Euryarchaeota archaeon]
MLAEILEKYKVINSVGNTIGKVKDIYLDLNTWNIVGFRISPGPLKKDFVLGPGEIVKFDTTDSTIIVNDDFEQDEIPKQPRKDMYPFDELKKHTVVDSEDKKIGKIYNLEIPYEKLKAFKVWRVLIKTGISERRLRLHPTEIKEVMETIKLKGREADYKEEAD